LGPLSPPQIAEASDTRTLETILDQSLDAVIGLSEDGRITYWNPSAEAIFGWSRLEAVGGSVVELVVPERYRPSHRRGLRRALATGARAILGRPIQLIGLRRDASEFPADVAVSGARVGDAWSFSAFVSDVSAHQQAERTRNRLEAQLLQAQRMEAVGRLAGGIAHDFNNLLTAVVGYSELVLRHTPEESPWRRYLLEIRRAGDRASALTRQLLAFSRKQVLMPQVLDVSRLVADLGDMLQWLIGEDIALETRFGEEPARVKADPAQLEQVILNLAVNARDAMPRGGRRYAAPRAPALHVGLHRRCGRAPRIARRARRLHPEAVHSGPARAPGPRAARCVSEKVHRQRARRDAASTSLGPHRRGRYSGFRASPGAKVTGHVAPSASRSRYT
jgi:PAS domain S-box-containing protein